ncbi:MAG: hypothetical protein M1812_007405 [Candelaria pacifica]|nr:MAG: hypothetical protein M1812_007405 [Candelaria pacifica]
MASAANPKVGELRNRVYLYAFAIPPSAIDPWRPNVSLLRISHQIHQESFYLLYSLPYFCVRGVSDLVRFLGMISPAALATLKYLRLITLYGDLVYDEASMFDIIATGCKSLRLFDIEIEYSSAQVLKDPMSFSSLRRSMDELMYAGRLFHLEKLEKVSVLRRGSVRNEDTYDVNLGLWLKRLLSVSIKENEGTLASA